MLSLIADHGMSDKSNEAGEPNVIWLQDILDAEFGEGETTVICPITTPSLPITARWVVLWFCTLVARSVPPCPTGH
ncbi:hypothetical protein PS691_03154 [Pseudomonas fluorescens]|uniref:Phosphonoacetate hydrolase n=1 Tax=Pseudomonas fluorescens TaxID=294 RepID=A0A5E7D0T8_PSEFL|nr:hypothetical protein PS691_03154 [Pseudomonas fluorescens]